MSPIADSAHDGVKSLAERTNVSVVVVGENLVSIGLDFFHGSYIGRSSEEKNASAWMSRVSEPRGLLALATATPLLLLHATTALSSHHRRAPTEL
jgi:hypothetical protein